ncbi:MAG TPA: amino acid adenylation domain-containing protein [Pyrinomonadaceae bacterium]
MSDQLTRIAGLSLEKQALLLRRLRERGDSARRQIKPRAPGTVSFPLSFSQQRLWFLNQLQPDSPFYNVPDTYRLDGRIDADVLERSFDALVRRHETLRTTFVTVGGEPRQIVNEPRPFVLQVTDLTDLPAAAREAEVLRLAEEESERLFDLSRDTLLRARLLRLGRDEHVLLMCTHHITSDGWSRGVLTGELMAFYEAFGAGREPALPELPVQYADYAVWQREYLSGEVLEEQLRYWREQLGGELPALELPTDRQRPPMPSYRGAYYQLEFPEKLGASLRALARENGATLFMVLLAAFDVLLYRYTGQTDLVVGTPTAGRNRREVENLIGFFVNTLVMRTNLGGNPTFRELLGRVREVALGAQSNQELPFEKLVEELHPQRDMSRNPLFQVAFGLQNAPEPDFELSGLTLTPLDVGGDTSRFDLEFHLWASDVALGGMVIYSTDLFEEASIARLHTHYVRLLEGIVSAPDARISDLPLLTVGERRQLLVEWNQTAAPFPRHECLHDLFNAQAARTPSAPAVVRDEQALTYAELEARSNQLAHHLVALGVKPEARVGVCLGRSPELIVALLGILKAGAAYLPLDPEYPAERLSFLLEDAGVSVVITQRQTEEAFVVQPVRQLLIDTHWPDISSMPETDPGTRVTAENLAYVIYTSGSTGTPKGVEVTHRAVARLLFPGAYARLAEGQSFLQLSTPSFDASTLEFWAPLLHGGRCVLAEERLPSPARLAELIERHAVSSAWLTSSLFNAVIDEQGEALGGLRQLLIGGEALSTGHVRRALELLPGVRLVNGYGPTESTTFTCCHEIGDGGEWGAAGVPIGRPIENTRVYVLDGRGEPVPVGVSGELLIGGEGLARGYLNRPGLTAERFIPDPFSGEAGARLYRSGDLARWRADGALEYLGRADEQVKLRGFRIEPGEVEAALRRHAGVADAAVIVREDEPGDRRLVAYFVTNREGAADEAELREYLKGKLPEYMVPSHVVPLDELPLTASGKTDRRALQALAPPEAPRRDSFVAPRDALEQQLADIWEEVLRAGRVGVHDNFFDLGGHSLLATRVVNLLRERCGVELPLRVMFESPTVEGTAQHVWAAGREQEDVDRLSSMLDGLEQLSEEEVRALLESEGDGRPGGGTGQ